MDSQNWFDFKDIKREVLPDGRIRYSAETIVTERIVEVPTNPEEYKKWISHSSMRLQNAIAKRIAETSPFFDA